jgi:hypothetical protein
LRPPDLVLTVVLLVNMLIAMMAKTFDNIAETKTQHYQLSLARTLLISAGRPIVPVPFTLLSLPYEACGAIRRCKVLWRPLRDIFVAVLRRCPSCTNSDAYGTLTEKSEVLSTEKEEELGFKVDVAKVAELMRNHSDESVQGELWRKQFSRSVGQLKSAQRKMDDKIDTKIDQTNEKIDGLQTQMAEMLALLQTLQAK